jgi:hypothetical protein
MSAAKNKVENWDVMKTLWTVSTKWVWGLFPQGVKWPWPEVNHPPTTTAKVQNEWNYSPTCFNGMDRGNFTFNFVTYEV